MKNGIQTNNSSYGQFARTENPDWRRTYITHLPTVKKNKQMENERRKFRTSGEEYGHFWRRNAGVGPTNHSRLSYGTTNPAKILYTEPKRDEFGGGETTRRVYVRTDDDVEQTEEHPPTDAHAEAQRYRKNRDRAWIERRQQNALPKVGSLPSIRNDGASPTRSRHPSRGANKTSPRPAETPPPNPDEEAAIRVGGRIADRLKLPDIKRIDLDLYAPDGEVVSITAVPIYLNTFHRK